MASAPALHDDSVPFAASAVHQPEASVHGGKRRQQKQAEDEEWNEEENRHQLNYWKRAEEQSEYAPRVVTPPSAAGFSRPGPSDETGETDDEGEEDRPTLINKRRKLDEERESRMQLKLEAEQKEHNAAQRSRIPEGRQLELMRRTYAAILASPSPALLEIRILTNHGQDQRFSSFLKRGGRFHEAWGRMKRNEPVDGNPPPAPIKDSLGGLADYMSSDEDGEEEGQDTQEKAAERSIDPGTNEDEDASESTRALPPQPPASPLTALPPSNADSSTTTTTTDVPPSTEPPETFNEEAYPDPDERRKARALFMAKQWREHNVRKNSR